MIGETELKQNIEKQTSYSVEAAKIISGSETSTTAVYRVRLSEGGIRFVRVLTEDWRDNLSAVSNVGPKYGFPPSTIIDAEPPLLLMERAPGHPLSRVLPAVLLPGVWALTKGSIMNGISNLGRFLGRLHNDTSSGMKPLSDTQTIPKLPNILDQIRDDITGVERIKDEFNSISNDSVQCARIHADPTPHNVFYHHESVNLIDFDLREDAIIIDQVRAERGLELMADRLPYCGSNKKQQLVREFRNGYHSEIEELQTKDQFDLIRCVLDCYLLSRYLTRQSQKRGARITKRTDVNILKNRITEYTSTQ